MKNNKWIKWLTGVSGAVLFTGLVGFMSANAKGSEVSTAVSGGSVATQEDGLSQGNRDDVASQWQNESGMDRNSFGSRYSGRGGSSAGTAMPDSGSGDSQLRTHAS